MFVCVLIAFYYHFIYSKNILCALNHDNFLYNEFFNIKEKGIILALSNKLEFFFKIRELL
jgi:hypothetical protein